MRNKELTGRTFLITGANTGIGEVAALSLGRRGATVVLACRSQERTRPVIEAIRATGNEAVHFIPLDLESLDSVRDCAQRFLKLNLPLDVLINNAGVAGQRGLTINGFELTFGINHLGHYLLTELLLPTMLESAKGRGVPGRIVTVASKAHYNAKGIDWARLQRPTTKLAMPEYSVSKLCNVLHTVALAKRLREHNIHAYALHPGVVATEIWRNLPKPLAALLKLFMLTSEKGARTTLYCATSPTCAEQSGLYYDNSKVRTPSNLAQDSALAEELMTRSSEWAPITPTDKQQPGTTSTAVPQHFERLTT